jgi:orotidine-5'-phosphate decarboxylase
MLGGSEWIEERMTVEDRVETSSHRHAVPARQEDVLERNRAETFNERLRRRWQEARTLLCVGLDGEIERMPEQFRRGLALDEANGSSPEERERRIEAALTEYHIAIVEATADLVCAYKPNIAFYEQHGPAGLRALITIIAYVQKKYPEIPVLLDAKRGDIGSTSQAYARALFDVYGADAVTAQPYLGYDALEPFLGRTDRGVFILCRTSNPGASELQDLSVRTDENGDEPLYLRVARRVANEWNAHGNCGLVVGATYPEELRRVREIVGDLPILAPGVGAQGGDLEATVRAGIDSARQGLLISVSRAILYASTGDDFASAARRQAGWLRMEIERQRGGPGSSGAFRKNGAAVASAATQSESR